MGGRVGVPRGRLRIFRAEFRPFQRGNDGTWPFPQTARLPHCAAPPSPALPGDSDMFPEPERRLWTMQTLILIVAFVSPPVHWKMAISSP